MAWEDQSLVCNGDAHQVVYDQKRGETVCSKCGLVIEERKIETEYARLRVYTSRRKKIPASKTTSIFRCSNPRSIKGKLHNLLKEKSHPRPVQEKAIALCKSLYKMHIATGYNASIVAKTLLYTAYRLSHIPVTLSHLTSSQKERKRIAHCYNKICTKLESKVPKLTYKDYLSILTAKAKVDKETEALANKVLAIANENHVLGGANPMGIAATALYLATVLKGPKATQKKMAKAAGVSEVTIRANYRTIREHSAFQLWLVNDEFKYEQQMAPTQYFTVEIATARRRIFETIQFPKERKY